jgi:hypothetical protein
MITREVVIFVLWVFKMKKIISLGLCYFCLFEVVVFVEFSQRGAMGGFPPIFVHLKS